MPVASINSKSKSIIETDLNAVENTLSPFFSPLFFGKFKKKICSSCNLIMEIEPKVNENQVNLFQHLMIPW